MGVAGDDMSSGVTASAGTLLSKFRRHGTIALSLLTVLALCIHPLPFCIDCEFPDPWGHQSSAVDVPLLIWLLVAPFLAGLFAVRKGWLVPICVVLALLATQSIGGVAWWSLRENEGPFILIFGLLTTAICFGIGYLIHMATKMVLGRRFHDIPMTSHAGTR